MYEERLLVGLRYSHSSHPVGIISQLLDEDCLHTACSPCADVLSARHRLLASLGYIAGENEKVPDSHRERPCVYRFDWKSSTSSFSPSPLWFILVIIYYQKNVCLSSCISLFTKYARRLPSRHSSPTYHWATPITCLKWGSSVGK